MPSMPCTIMYIKWIYTSINYCNFTMQFCAHCACVCMKCLFIHAVFPVFMYWVAKGSVVVRFFPCNKQYSVIVMAAQPNCMHMQPVHFMCSTCVVYIVCMNRHTPL